ncbi:MAG: glycosyltransferase, partial [Ignavibacteriaceae bacterium]|nr:glycosyltransferase [Ignavibacteriaceae bacterium]
MNKNKILVSAIVSTFNSEKFIRSRIENLLQQTLADKLEIVIVNSGSKQNEDKIVSEYLFKHPNIKYIRTKERETIYKAWNRGIKLSEGRYITNANTDDHLRNDALEIFSDYLDRNADVVLVYADYYITNLPDQNFNNTNGLRLQSNKDFNKLLLLESCYIGPQPMWRADVHFKDNIWFDESLEIAGDYEFECNLAQRYKFHHIKNPLGIYYK